MLGLGQFALLIGLFVKLWIIAEGDSEAIWTVTALIIAYMLFTFQQVRNQITATKAIQNVAGKRAYVTFIKAQRTGEGLTRLMAVGLAIGCLAALPELLFFLEPTANWIEGTVFFTIFMADAARLYMTC